jgi:hypothetical protein
MVLRLISCSPRRRIRLVTVIGELTVLPNPVGPQNLRQLDTSNGCQDHTTLPSAASPGHAPRPARMLPEEVLAGAFKRRSSARRSIAHGKPALRSRSRPTLPRPPHPIPTSVTIMIRPSVGDGTAGFLKLIWVRREEKYFCKEDWTGFW